MPAFYTVNFEVADNEDLSQSFSLGTDAPGPVDITGAALKMGIASLSGQIVLEASLANGMIGILDAANGQFELNLPAARLRALPPGSYLHDLLITLASGRVHRVWAGSLTLTHGVTS